MTFSQRVTFAQELLLLNGFVVAVTGKLDNQTKVALQKFDNRFDPSSQSIDTDLFLNLYLSVPIESSTQPKNDLRADEAKKEDSVEGSGESGSDGIPSTATILKALLPVGAEPSSTTRGPGGRHTPIQQQPDRQLEIDLLIPFELNQYKMTKAALPILNRLGRALAAPGLKGVLFEIQGHTCNLGRGDYNLWLSQKRAEAVKDYLITNFGFQPTRLRAMGYGMQRPKYGNDTDENRAKNRRVTIVNTQRAVQKYHSPPKLQVVANYLRGGREMQIQDGMSLTSNDNYALAFSADQACHVYVFQFDSKATVTQLFPNADFNGQVNPVGPRNSVRLPGNGQEWFFLDDTRGAEELLVIAYPESLPDPLAVAKSLAEQREPNLFPFASREVASTRGPGGVRVRQSPDDLLFVWRNQFFNEE